MKSSTALFTLLLLCGQSIASQSTNILPPSLPTMQKNFEADTLYQLLIAEMALNRQDLPTALAAYTAAAQETQDPQIAAKATDLAILLGRPKVALVTAKIWADKQPEDLEAQAITALLFISQHQNTQSVPYLRRLQVDKTDVSVAYFQVLYEQLALPQDKSFFIKTLTTLREDRPETLGASLALVNIYLIENNPTAALAISTPLVAKDLNNETLTIMHSEGLRLTGENAASLKFVEKTLKRHPEMVDLRLYHAEVLLKIDNLAEKARAHMDILAHTANLSTQATIQALNVSFDAQWFETSEIFLEKLQTNPQYAPMAAYFFGRICEIKKEDDAAMQWYAQIEGGPFYVVSRIHAANILSHQKQYEAALQLIASTYPETHADLKMLTLIEVDLLAKLNQPKAAIAALELGIADAPNDLDLRYIRSILYEKMGNISEAASDLRFILEKKPQHIEALNGLGYLLTNYDDKHAEALLYLEQAYALAPKNAGILDSLGWAHYHLGDHQKALSFLKTAHQLENDSLIAAHLGAVLWESGHIESAKSIWASAHEGSTDLHPDFDTIVRQYMPETVALEEK